MPNGLKKVFLVHVFVSLAFGLPFILFPEYFGEITKWAPIDPAMMKFMGAALVALAVGGWYGYKATSWGQVKILVQVELTFTVLGFFGGLYDILTRENSPTFIWVPIATLALFTVLWIYFLRQATE